MPPELDEEVTMRPADGDGREDAIEQLAEKGAATYPAIWAQVMADRPNGPARPGEVPVPESIEEVTAWAGKEDSRRVELIYAPIFWVVLPVAALGGMIWGSIADPRDGWTGTFLPVENNEPPWNFGLGWAAVTVWLLIMVGVLVVRLSVFRGLRAENRWVFEHGVPYSIHRSSVDYDDGETSGWPTYIALNHRLDGSVAKIGGSQR